ncbi:hypothetical protein [Halopelagius fulvigenes]|uniref:Uncharacterized protein n=1 Tax=Halopelagius fulvigenes TaxID=1198324 RepID=A0ABD5TZM1_9EURY
MDLSDTAKDGTVARRVASFAETTTVETDGKEVHNHSKRDEFMSNETPNTESIPTRAHSIETTDDEIQNSMDGLCCISLPGEID